MSKKLDSLENEGKLIKVNHSYWASPVFLVPKKSGDFRLCIDLKQTLNPSLKTDIYPLPTLKDIFFQTKWWRRVLRFLTEAYT